MVPKIRDEILEMLANDNIEEAINKLKAFGDKTVFYKDVIVNSATLERINRAYKKDIISWELMSRKKNQVIIALTEIVDETKPD